MFVQFICRSVFPCGDEMVAIIDDREDVWSRCPNLIHVKPYVFFAGTADINAPPPRPSEAPPTSSSMHPLNPDGVPFKVRHMTSSRNNNMKPQVGIATQHQQFPSVPESQPPPKASENNVTSENRVCEYSPSRMNVHVSTSQSSASIKEGSKKEPHLTPQPENIGCDTTVKLTEEVVKDDHHESSCSGVSGSTVFDIAAQPNGNKNNNNNNGDDPKSSDKAKEEDSSSSSTSSSSSEGEDEGKEGEGEKEADGDSSSSSSGIDDNLFDSLEEKVEQPAPPELDGARGGVKAVGVVGVNKVEIAGKEVKQTIEGVDEIEGEVANGSNETNEKGGGRDKTGT